MEELRLCSSITWSLFHHVLLIASLRSGTSLNWIISSSSDNICTLTIAWEYSDNKTEIEYCENDLEEKHFNHQH